MLFPIMCFIFFLHHSLAPKYIGVCTVKYIYTYACVYSPSAFECKLHAVRDLGTFPPEARRMYDAPGQPYIFVQ